MRLSSVGYSERPLVALLVTLLALAPASAASLAGVVTDSAGRPATALVTAGARGRDQGTPPVATDAEGRFSIELPAELTGDLEVAAYGEAGFGLYQGPAEVALALPLEPVSWVEGWAVGPDRRPLPHGEVCLIAAAREGLGGRIYALLTSRLLRAPIREGRWRLPVPRETQGGLLATAPGLAPAAGQFDARDPAGPLLVLRQPATLSGEVRAVDGGTVAGVRVTVSAITRQVTETDPNGRFELTGLLPGLSQVSFWQVARGPFAINQTVTSLLPAGGSATVRAVAEPAGMIRVEVVDEASRRPIAGASVLGEPTNANGLVRLFLPPGAQHLTASAPGWRATPRSSALVEVSPGNAAPPLVLSLQRGARLAGVVVDRAGRPVAGAKVELEPTGETALTDAAGAFGLDSLEPQPAGGTALVARLGAELARLPIGEQWPRGPLRLVLEAADTAVVSGLVTDQAGRPLPGARVSVRYGGTALTSLNFRRAGERSVATRTGADGVYRVADLPTATPLAVRVERDGYRTSERMLRGVGSPEAEIEPIRLGVDSPGVSGRILNPDGAPAVAALVATGRGRFALTDAQGRYGLPGAADGQILAVGGALLRAEGPAARGREVELRLREAPPPGRTAAADRDLAAELAEGIWAASQGEQLSPGPVLELLARLDPELALARASRLTPAAAAELPGQVALDDQEAGLRLFRGLDLPPVARLTAAARLLLALPPPRWPELEPLVRSALAEAPEQLALAERAALAAAFEPSHAELPGRRAVEAVAGQPAAEERYYELRRLWLPFPQLAALVPRPEEDSDALLEVVWLTRLAAGQPLVVLPLLRQRLDLWREPDLQGQGELLDALLRGLLRQDRAAAAALVRELGAERFGALALTDLALASDPKEAGVLLALAEAAARGKVGPASLEQLAYVGSRAKDLDPPRHARLAAELAEIARSAALAGRLLGPALAPFAPDEAWLTARSELESAWRLQPLQVLHVVDPEAAAELATGRGLERTNLAETLRFAAWLLEE